MEAVKLKFPSGFHVDQKGANRFEVADDFLHSDTISSAILLTWQALYPEDINESFFIDPPYRISSAFPFVRDLLLFPKPIGPIWGPVEEEQRKNIKKIKWLSCMLLKELQEGKKIKPESVTFLNENTVAVNNSELRSFPFGTNEALWVVSERQRVTVDRVGSAEGGDTFFFASLHFRPDCGLWFAYEAQDKKKFLSVLNLLGDNGIGSDRSCGLGHFSVEEGKLPHEIFHFRGEYHITLSLYNPSQGENVRALLTRSAYDITKRSGWISKSTVGRPHIFAFMEGAFFPFEPKGRVVKVLSKETIERFKLPIEHEVYRDFRPLTIQSNIPGFLKEVAP